ncbi:MAG: TldD/PmbA family protein [Candidatus Thorarchaeota archaeon]|jgi:predicted Zn-dependent protease
MEFHKQMILDKTSRILKEAQRLRATEAHASITLENLSLTRLANSAIDQNVSEKHATVLVTLYYGKKSGTAKSEVFGDEEIRNLVKTAEKVAQVSPENKDFKSLPEPLPIPELSIDRMVSKTTYDADPERRAELATLAVDTSHSIDKRVNAVAGYVSDLTIERVVGNSSGVEVYEVRTESEVEITALAKDGNEETAGWASDMQKDTTDLHVEEVARIAAEKASNGFQMQNLEPGHYEVVLEPAAAAGLVFWSSLVGFSAKRYQEYMSYMRDRIGEKVFSDKLSIWDDPLDPRVVAASAFDLQGVPHQKVELVREGVARNLLYDNITATKDGVKSTGNSVSWWGPPMPAAFHLFAAEGDSSIDEMIAETKRGVLVTHFHYQNPVNPTEGVFTGLTRDGTWYIENGEIKHPLRTLRYTDAAPRFFGGLDLIGCYPNLNLTFPNGLIPPMKLPSFRFSGSSEG